jgi:hypothetical protein
MMSVADLIETAAAKYGETANTALLGYTIGRKYTSEIKGMFGEDVAWLEARKVLDVPITDSNHLPPFRVDMKNWYLLAASNGYDWEITAYPRLRGTR